MSNSQQMRELEDRAEIARMTQGVVRDERDISRARGMSVLSQRQLRQKRKIDGLQNRLQSR